jgi:hypothetical protein
MGWGGDEVALKWTNRKNSGDVAGLPIREGPAVYQV